MAKQVGQLKLFICGLAALLFISPVAHAQNLPEPIVAGQARTLPVAARSGMVVAQEARAARIGVDILKQGGNAVDAAIATGFALAVTLPRAGNIGGAVSCWCIWLAAER